MFCIFASPFSNTHPCVQTIARQVCTLWWSILWPLLYLYLFHCNCHCRCVLLIVLVCLPPAGLYEVCVGVWMHVWVYACVGECPSLANCFCSLFFRAFWRAFSPCGQCWVLWHSFFSGAEWGPEDCTYNYSSAACVSQLSLTVWHLWHSTWDISLQD